MKSNIKSFQLDVSTRHTLFVSTSGNPNGQPVIICHGGPGGGSSPDMHEYHDPAHYYIIVFDQRGCGQSTPFGELRDNTTWDLVSDMEAIREHLGIKHWQVFGGSWGATLALTYAQTHPDRVTSLILRGVFLCQRDELHWLYQEGANALFPDAWDAFIEPILPEERGDMIAAYYKRLVGPHDSEQEKCAIAWSRWEGQISRLLPHQDFLEDFTETQSALALARIETHYFVNQGFYNRQNHVANNIDKIADIPGIIVQGRYDVVTPMKTAWNLHKAWPKSKFVIVDDAGHSAQETGIKAALKQATVLLQNKRER